MYTSILEGTMVTENWLEVQKAGEKACGRDAGVAGGGYC